MKKTAQSLLDVLIHLMPELKDNNFATLIKNRPSNRNGEMLYNIWKDKENKISNFKFKRPPTISEKDINQLVSAGMIEIQGKNLKVTNSGTLALRKMILENDSFSLNEDSNLKTASKNNKNNWYTRFKNG